ncbi:Doublestrandbreak repair protein rad21 [Seminavis robusta]|uniref:Doublestrandbreak repair protein rad21 n=1 Tax=Seminavis robusta TaxID=568900 RepID=A0A9N8H0T0_9STRA|nr:Doublestrandbreak repair protein rad21 [Seminavis robusta]|eukprot:Sro6_g004820.1 Doublestrandbreak repair protein rad21 (426) ;mRNA; r:18861-20138
MDMNSGKRRSRRLQSLSPEVVPPSSTRPSKRRKVKASETAKDKAKGSKTDRPKASKRDKAEASKTDRPKVSKREKAEASKQNEKKAPKPVKKKPTPPKKINKSIVSVTIKKEEEEALVTTPPDEPTRASQPEKPKKKRTRQEPYELRRNRRKIVIDNDSMNLEAEHIRNMLRDTGDITLQNVAHPADWNPQEQDVASHFSGSATLSAMAQGTEGMRPTSANGRTLEFGEGEDDHLLRDTLPFGDLLIRPSLGDDGQLAPELLQLWHNNLAHVEGKPSPYPKLTAAPAVQPGAPPANGPSVQAESDPLPTIEGLCDTQNMDDLKSLPPIRLQPASIVAPTSRPHRGSMVEGEEPAPIRIVSMHQVLRMDFGSSDEEYEADDHYRGAYVPQRPAPKLFEYDTIVRYFQEQTYRLPTYTTSTQTSLGH